MRYEKTKKITFYEQVDQNDAPYITCAFVVHTDGAHDPSTIHHASLFRYIKCQGGLYTIAQCDRTVSQLLKMHFGRGLIVVLPHPHCNVKAKKVSNKGIKRTLQQRKRALAEKKLHVGTFSLTHTNTK